MSLNTNLKKIFEQHFKTELGIEVVKASTPSNFDNSEGAGSTEAGIGSSLEGIGGNEKFIITDEQINDIAAIASRENLELGCMLIKKKVIEKALRKVREDIQITQAVERR